MNWFWLILACESMSNPGSPFSPVSAVSTALSTASTLSSEASEGAEVDFEFQDPQEVLDYEGSEAEPVVIAVEAAEEIPSTVTTTENSEYIAPRQVVTEAETVITEEMVLMSSSGATISASPSVSVGQTGWPIRLLGTVPGAQPPRAVLGLPTGEEIVVTPGMLIPAQQLVVMSIGNSQVQLAKIVPMGDHAAIKSMSLQAQYSE